MKTITVKYKQGLASFLDMHGMKWVNMCKDEMIKIYLPNTTDQNYENIIFTIGFNFGCFYSDDNNY